MREIDLKAPFESPYFTQYYTGYRNKIEDLFDSERRFIAEFIADGESCLDIGCALGGMFDILAGLRPGISYNGVDISPNLVAEAQRLRPGLPFRVFDGGALPFSDRQFARVITLGTTVHDQNYLELLAEAWRVTDEKLLFDIRLTPLPEVSSLDEGYVQDGSGVRYPYVVANAARFFAWIAALSGLAIVKAYGYWGRANQETTLPAGCERICMACFLLEKSQAQQPRPDSASWHLELPLELNASEAVRR